MSLSTSELETTAVFSLEISFLQLISLTLMIRDFKEQGVISSFTGTAAALEDMQHD